MKIRRCHGKRNDKKRHVVLSVSTIINTPANESCNNKTKENYVSRIKPGSKRQLLQRFYARQVVASTQTDRDYPVSQRLFYYRCAGCSLRLTVQKFDMNIRPRHCHDCNEMLTQSILPS